MVLLAVEGSLAEVVSLVVEGYLAEAGLPRMEMAKMEAVPEVGLCVGPPPPR